MTPEQMDEVMARHFAAEDAADLDGILATLTPDAVHDVVGDPDGALSDPQAIAARYQRTAAAFTETAVEPVRRLYGEDFLVDECRMHARATGEVFGLPGRNRPLSFRLLHVCEFRDGRISRENVWLDLAAILQQLNEPD